MNSQVDSPIGRGREYISVVTAFHEPLRKFSRCLCSFNCIDQFIIITEEIEISAPFLLMMSIH
jgi:hypothetical protein